MGRHSWHRLHNSCRCCCVTMWNKRRRSEYDCDRNCGNADFPWPRRTNAEGDIGNHLRRCWDVEKKRLELIAVASAPLFRMQTGEELRSLPIHREAKLSNKL